MLLCERGLPWAVLCEMLSSYPDRVRHLLLAAAKLSECMPELKDYLAEEWKRIRFIGLPREIDDAQLGELSGIGTPGHQQYYIGCADTAASVVKTVECEEPFRTFISAGSKAGLCVSGCYAKR